MGVSRNRERRTLAGPIRRLAWLALVLSAAGHAAAAAEADAQVPEQIQRRIEDRFADRFVYPDTSDWVFKSIAPYPGGSKIVCGTVNYQNAMRRYVGAKHFYAILDDKSISSIGIDMDENEDRTGEGAFKMKTLCHLP